MFVKKLGKIFLFIILIFFFILIHEHGHGTAATITGGGYKGVIFVENGWKSYFTSQSYCYTRESYMAMLLFGSLSAIIIASILSYIAYRKEWKTVYLSSTTVIFYELLYWTISPFLGFGDAYWFFFLAGGVNLGIYLFFMVTVLTVTIQIILGNYIKMVDKYG